MENIRRFGELAKLFVESGTITLTSFISPFISDRARARALLAEGDFIEVFCDSSLDVCESRDVKGLYAKARAGEIPTFTGISSPYEVPENPEIVAETGRLSLQECVDQVIAYLLETKIIS